MSKPRPVVPHSYTPRPFTDKCIYCNQGHDHPNHSESW